MTLRSLFAAHLAGESGTSEFIPERPTSESLSNFSVPGSIHTDAHQTICDKLSPFAELDPALQQALDHLPDAEVICAGQQPGLFGGPMLGLYKALTAVALAQRLNEQGRQCVAVFWNASEDHDLDEANRCAFPFHHEDYEPAWFRSEELSTGRHLAETRFSASAIAVMAARLSSLQLDRAWLPAAGESFGSWHTRLMMQMTKGTGLIVVEPHWFDSVGSAFKWQLFQSRRAAIDLIRERTSALRRAGFRTPVNYDSEDETGYFLIRGPQRLKLKAQMDGLLTDGQEVFSEAQLEVLLASGQATLSPGVLFRPLFQQHIFPVIAQVAGPTEADYLAQLTPVFSELDIRRMIVWPRTRFLLVNAESREQMKSLGLSDEELAASRFPEPPESVSGELVEDVDSVLGHYLDPSLMAPGPSGQKTHAAFRRNILSHWRRLKKELERTEKVRRKPYSRAVHYLKNVTTPRGMPQERIMPPAATGFPCDQSLAELLLRCVDPFDPTEKVVHL